MQAENEKIIESWREFADLRVALSVELGCVPMTVRDILELQTASVIKLSRSTGEGVDVRAGEQSLLRGEIIVIEDRAGVRVNEIITEAK